MYRENQKYEFVLIFIFLWSTTCFDSWATMYCTKNYDMKFNEYSYLYWWDMDLYRLHSKQTEDFTSYVDRRIMVKVRDGCAYAASEKGLIKGWLLTFSTKSKNANYHD